MLQESTEFSGRKIWQNRPLMRSLRGTSTRESFEISQQVHLTKVCLSIPISQLLLHQRNQNNFDNLRSEVDKILAFESVKTKKTRRVIDDFVKRVRKVQNHTYLRHFQLNNCWITPITADQPLLITVVQPPSDFFIISSKNRSHNRD